MSFPASLVDELRFCPDASVDGPSSLTELDLAFLPSPPHPPMRRDRVSPSRAHHWRFLLHVSSRTPLRVRYPLSLLLFVQRLEFGSPTSFSEANRIGVPRSVPFLSDLPQNLKRFNFFLFFSSGYERSFCPPPWAFPQTTRLRLCRSGPFPSIPLL